MLVCNDVDGQLLVGHDKAVMNQFDIVPRPPSLFIPIQIHLLTL